MKESILSAEQLTLFFEDQETPVLQDINLRMDEGESLLLLGPSGSGKSSLTQCLNGLFPRELDGRMSGQVKIFGKDTLDYAPGEVAQHVGVVFQDPETQFCMLTVENEIAFGLENICVPQEEMARRVDEVLEQTGLMTSKGRPIHELSGGQKQKLALACVLVMGPEVLILDEPTANLDPVAKTDFIRLLQQMKEERSLTLIVIEHQLEGWLDLMERVLLLTKEGTVFSDGPLHTSMSEDGYDWEALGLSLPYVTRTAMDQGASPPLPLTIREADAFSPPHRRPFESKASHPICLETKDLSWRTHLNDVNVRIHEGEWLAVAGENGSGKTTLSKLLAGITKPSEGDVFLRDKPVKKWKEEQLRYEIGYVFQNPEHQFITDTVFEEVAFSLKIAGKPQSSVQQKVRDTLELCRLDGLEDHHPFQLSQGQKRRLSVATMIVDDQRILLLDEPTFGQDAASTESLMKLLDEKNKQGTTIIMITHDMELVDRFTSRVLVMKNGRLTWDGHPEDLWNHPDLSRFHLDLPPRIQWMNERHERKWSHLSS